MSHTSWEGLEFQMDNALAKGLSACDKKFILQAGTVATLRKVVLVWFINVVAR